MPKEEWFRNTKWSEKIEEFFELKLKRARGTHNRAQYLRIQGSYLLNSDVLEFQLKGIELMNRLKRDYPEETFHAVFATEQLGDYYQSIGNMVQAEECFRTVTDHYYKNTRSGTSGIVDVKLCRLIVETRQSDKYEDAERMLTHDIERSKGLFTLNSERYYYTETLALLYDQMNRVEDAKSYAQEALKLDANKTPQFPRHQTVGLVDVSDVRIREMKRIVNS